MLKAAAAVWPTFPHDVTLAAHQAVTLITTEVLHVPTAALSLRALISEDDLKNKIQVISFNNRQRYYVATFRNLYG